MEESSTGLARFCMDITRGRQYSRFARGETCDDSTFGITIAARGRVLS